MTVSKPSVTISLIPANESISTGPQRVLFVGQMTTGTAVSGVLSQDVGNANEWDALFGANSMLAGAIRTFRKINKVTPIDVIPLADATGVNASGTVAFTGPSTAAGTIYVTVGSYTNHRYALAITSGMTATQIGAALVTAITADTKAPFTAVNTTGSVAITYVHDGTEGNYVGLRVEGSVAGVGVTVTAFASGATNPTLTGIFSVVADTRYQTVVWPTGYATTEVLANFLDPRFNPTNAILDGVMIQTSVDSKANIKTAVTAMNNQNAVIVAVKAISNTTWKGNMAQEFPFVVSAHIAALRSLRLTQDANIASYVTTTTGTLDTIGGPAIAGLPYFNTPMDFIPLIPVGMGWSASDIDELLVAGASAFGNNRTNNRVILGDFVTTYKNDAAGNVDVTFKYLNNVDVGSTVREYYWNNFKKQYSQSRLTEGDLVPNRSMANPKSIEGYADQIYDELSGVDYVLLQRGEAAKTFFKENRKATVNMSTGTCTFVAQVPIITQLRSIIFPMQIAFSVAS